mgnify:CR=1 FL=1
MKIISTDGIVVSSIPFKESSRIINILTKDMGIVGCIVKGCKSLKSKLRLPSEKFAYGTFHFYYKEKKLSFTKPEEVYKRALQMAKKGRILTFHWRGGYLTKTVLEELLDLIEKAGAEKGKKPRISLNWPQAVIRFGYVDAEIAGSSAAEEVQMEEANEGEMHSD